MAYSFYIIMKVLKLFYLTIFGIMLAPFLSACDQQEDPTPTPPEEVRNERTVLVYAIGSNNLDSYLRYDKAEMIDAAPLVDGLGSRSRVLLYEVPSVSSQTARLSELKKTEAGEWEFQELKNYDRATFSTDPARMKEVFADVKELAKAENYGLVLWSHATGWKPDFDDHGDSGMKRSFGVDTFGGVSDHCDIIELAEAIPDRMFDYVWFDCCYMMQIETAYQLRGKCDYIGGYPTEDWAEGMNYDETLPLLAAPQPDLIGVAQRFFNYYASRGEAATVTVAATSGLEALAAATREIYSICPPLDISAKAGLQNYSRLRSAPGMYDFGQYTLKMTESIDGIPSVDLPAAFDAALADVVVWGKCTAADFDGHPAGFNPDIYSGFSCHFPDTGTASQEQYYKSLDWYSAVY